MNDDSPSIINHIYTFNNEITKILIIGIFIYNQSFFQILEVFYST